MRVLYTISYAKIYGVLCREESALVVRRLRNRREELEGECRTDCFRCGR